MKRICVLGAAVAGLLTAGIPAIAVAASKPAAKTAITHAKPGTTSATTAVTCTFGLTTQLPAGDASLTPGASSGRQFGNDGCGAPLYKGVVHDEFTIAESGNFSGPVQQWFRVGSLTGKFKLEPNSNLPPTPTTFSSQAYLGTITISGGTGALRGTTGTGTMRCSSADQVHYACKERLKLTLASAGSSASAR